MNRATHAALICFALAGWMAPNGLAETRFPVEFAEPAWATGNAQTDGAQWVFLVFHAPSQAAYDVHTAPATVTNYTTLYEKMRWEPVVDRGSHSVDYPPSQRQFPNGFDARLRFTDYSWSSLYVEADRITLRQGDSDSRISLVHSGENLQQVFPPVYVPSEFFYRHLQPLPASVVLGTRGTGASGFPVSLEATGLRRLEWLNATVDCLAGPCPDSGRPRSDRVDLAGDTLVQRLSFIDVQSTSGALSGIGDPIVVVAGGASPAMGLTGRLRLPDTQITGGVCPQGPCPNPSGRTFLGEGRMQLNDVGQASGHRLRATLSGEFDSAAFDEATTTAFSPEVVVASALALGLVFVAWKVGLALFARSSRPPALEHPRRRKLYGTIREEPGLSFRSLQRRLEWPVGTLQHHLRRLQDVGLVVAEPYRGSLHFFESRKQNREDRLKVVQLGSADARRLYEWVAAHPGANQTAIVEATATWSWTRAKTLRRLTALNEAGLLAIERRGRRACYLPILERAAST